MKDSTKKYLKRVFIGYLFVLAAFIINRYLEYRNRYFYNLTEKTLKTGAEMIYDDKLNIIGKIEYKNSDTGLNLSINGKEITGKKQIQMRFIDSIQFFMNLLIWSLRNFKKRIVIIIMIIIQ